MKTNMASQWGSSSSSESGILRKNKPKDNYEDLLVFGYACKLFRDDEKALYIDQGKHLIPWMGDDKLKIDRYDCRGALSDLSPYESSREGYDAMRWLGLNESDRRIEQMCDKERYYSLQINEEEEQMYKEEEQKRQKATNQYQYSYDVPADPAKMQESGAEQEQNEEEVEYVPAPSLDVPVDITIPKTVKEYARIEKTAMFVAKQGLQMEILIKAKQSDNPQFGFLNQGNDLYKFYRHVLSAIKNGRYVSLIEQNENKQIKEEATNEAATLAERNNDDEHYLHPSLVSTAQPPSSLQPPQTLLDKTTIAAIPYKPSANCSYSQLVNRIQQSGNNQQQSQQQPPEERKLGIDEQQQQQQQQYYQYYYAAQYYEYYKQLAQYQQNGGQQQPVTPDLSNLDPNLQNYIQQMAYTQYMQQQQNVAPNNNNAYAQIVSNVSSSNKLPPNNSKATTNEKSETKKTSVLPLLAAYGSSSDDDDDDSGDDGKEEEEKCAPPQGEIQVVIDKMALYVSKNGEQFEEIVKAKGDPRFEFLNRTNQYFAYYKQRLSELKANAAVTRSVTNESGTTRQVMMKEKKVIAPVCFSIKKSAKDECSKEVIISKSALPVEESDDEEDEAQEKEESSEKNEENVSHTPPPLPPVAAAVPPPIETATIEVKKDEEIEEKSTNGLSLFDQDDPILEMIDLTDDLIGDDKKDARRAEDKIKDKLAAAAREKMVSVARDRALQLERKKKAAAFLKLKSAANRNDDNNGGGGGKDGKDNEEKTIIKEGKSGSRNNERIIDLDSEEEDGEDREGSRDQNSDVNNQQRQRTKSQKKKKSHKRKHSKSRSSSRKKSKRKHRHRSNSESSSSNHSS